LRVDFRVGRDLDVEAVAGLGTDEAHQVAGVMEFTAHAVTAGQVATQGYQALDTHALQGGQLLADTGAGGTNTRQMRGCRSSLSQNVAHGVESALLGGAARAKGHRAKLGLEGVQSLAHHAQFFHPFRGFGREKLNADRKS